MLALALVFGLAGAVVADDGPQADAPTYHEDVAPILQKRCQVCHREGEIGPFPLRTYEDAIGYSEMIGEVVDTRRMPPWHADPSVGEFSNSRRLSDAERHTILDWVAAGSPQGDPETDPPPVEFSDPQVGWAIGEPDAVFSMPQPFHVPAIGTVEYQYYDLPTSFGEDKWISAMEVRIGAREAVHHVLVFVRYPKGSGLKSPKVNGGLEGYFASALPGDLVQPFPEGTAKFLPKGSTLRFQIHYTTNGEEHVDLTKMAIKFADPTQQPIRRLRTLALSEMVFKIPPGASKHVIRAGIGIKQDSMLIALTPHMHLRGKSFRYVVRYPDGTFEPLLQLPRWDFNWQNTYRLAKPKFLPKGSRVVGIAVYDNSAENPANPDPTSFVHFGEQTWNEMMIGYLDLVDAEPADRTAWEQSSQAKQ